MGIFYLLRVIAGHVISEDALLLSCNAGCVSCAVCIFNSHQFPLVMGLLGLEPMVGREASVIGKNTILGNEI